MVNPLFKDPGRDGEIARALNVALQALVVHHGMKAISEGENITMNFAAPIETVRRALEILGVRRDEILPYMAAATHD
ncbi:hypothetical protein [Caballeronia telluris]|uniref:Uncharacterized protein n=1 Tax=Caballeronia telluris TaxID=326475 RepID=A0A158G0I3_9BURK|nr:hypothetical protein [Caballeronia telluris]SAL25387.1 hypothetical protein AWB66_01452 [Caballeronia telluris]